MDETEETYGWSLYDLADNRANNIMIWKSGHFANGVSVEEEPKIVYVIDTEDLYKLIEGCLSTNVMEKKLISGIMYDVSFKNQQL